MLRKLEQLKKPVSLLFFAVSAAVLLPAALLTGQLVVRLLLLFMLVIHTAIAAVYFARGVVWLVIGLEYYGCLLLGGLLDAAVWQLNIAGRSSHILTLIGLLPFLIANSAFSMQKRSREKITQLLHGTFTESAKPEDLLLRHLGGKSYKQRESRRVSYDSFSEYRRMAIYMQKPYSLGACSAEMRKTRMVLGIVLMVLGVAGLVLFAGTEYSNELDSTQAFFTAVFSAAAFLGGSVLIFAGFLRALVTALGCGAVFTAALAAYRFFKTLPKDAVPPYAVLGGSILLSAAIVAGILVRKYAMRSVRSLVYYETDDGFTGADLLLKNAVPVEGYDTLITVRIQTDGALMMNALQSFNDTVFYSVNNRKLIAAGAIYQTRTMTYSLYVYAANPARAQKQLKRVLRSNLRYQYVLNVTKDPGWKVYSETLYPSPKTMMELENADIIEMLEASGFDFTEETPVVFELFFHSRADGEGFVKTALTRGFENARGIDAKNENEPLPLEDALYMVWVQKTCKLGLAQINSICASLLELAAAHNGEYFRWEPGELVEEQTECEPEPAAVTFEKDS